MISIEILLDIDDLSVEEIVSCLKAIKNDNDISVGRDGKKLYLMEEE
jgi:hypothetical protein